MRCSGDVKYVACASDPGVSVDYCVRLEQGRIGAVSDQVLDAVAGALRLTDTERTHLSRLAARRRPARDRAHRAQVDPGLQRLLDSWPTTPAHILDHRMNVVAANDLCIGLFAGVGWDLTGESNGARLVFFDPAAREFYLEWAEKAESIVTYLRLAAGRHPVTPNCPLSSANSPSPAPSSRHCGRRTGWRRKAAGRCGCAAL